MNQEEILEKMHLLHLMLADEMKRICEKNNIKYFMTAGTLLGAVRHKGFIPWDDDMDFGMLREDYDKFIKACSKDLDTSKFYLQTDANEKFYTFNFAKLRLKGTSVLEEFSKNTDTHQGIYIDISPFDVVPNDIKARKRQFRQFWYYRNLLWIKCGYGTADRKKKLSYKVAKFIARHYSIEYLKRKKHECITQYRGQKMDNVVASDGSYGLEKETLKRAWVDNLQMYKFEDREYLGIKDYDAYLSYFYGDYMKVPPKSERNHHQRLNVDFGDYYK